MRQLVGFLEAIRVRNTTKEYYRNSFTASLHGAEIKPLEDILGVSLGEETAFDPDVEAQLEKLALENLEKAKRGR